jgi:glutathione S-transferase
VAERDTQAIVASGEKTASLLAMLDARLAGRDYVCGAQPTLADISLGINTYRWFNLPWDVAGFRRPALPALSGWYERLVTRPAYRQVVMIPIT